MKYLDHLEDPVSQEDLDTVYHRLEGSLQTQPRSRSRGFTGWPMAGLAVAAFLLVWWSLGGAQESGLMLVATGDALGDLESGRLPVELSDGSTIALAEGARIATLENGSSQVRLLMTPGRAAFDIQPDGPRAWSIDADGFVVDVLGTEFVIERSATHGMVHVTRGRVRVRGSSIEGGFRVLEAGQRLRIVLGSENEGAEALSPPPRREAEQPRVTPEPVESVLPEPVLPEPVLPEEDPSPEAATLPVEESTRRRNETGMGMATNRSRLAHWRQLSAVGEYRAAYREVAPTF